MAKRLTKVDLARYHELIEEQKQLRRRATDLNAEIEPLVEKFTEHVRANGGKNKLVQVCGYLLRLVSKPGTPAWKKEFVRLAGQPAAEELIGQQPMREELKVEAAA